MSPIVLAHCAGALIHLCVYIYVYIYTYMLKSRAWSWFYLAAFFDVTLNFHCLKEKLIDPHGFANSVRSSFMYESCDVKILAQL